MSKKLIGAVASSCLPSVGRDWRLQNRRSRLRGAFSRVQWLAPIFCGVLLASCSTSLLNQGVLKDDSVGQMMGSVANSQSTDLASLIPDEKINSVPRKLVAEGIKAYDKKDYEKASELFNAALKLDIRNSYLHFLNGLTYHQRALQGESQLFSLSEQGYLRAQTFDGSNWLPKYYLGLAKFDQGRYGDAKVQFASAVPYRDSDPQVLYHLAAAAYYDHDVRTADAAMHRLRQLNLPDREWKQRVAASSTLLAVAQNLPGEAQRNYSSYTSIAGQEKAKWLSDRMDSWFQVHRAVAQMPPSAKRRTRTRLAQIPGSGAPPGATGFPGFPEAPESPAAPQSSYIPEDQAAGPGFTPGDSGVDPKMVVVDVTIIRTEEDTTKSKGINLLSGLQIQFGDPLSATPGFSFNRNRVEDHLPIEQQAGDAINTRTITQLIGLPAINYSLNIANTQRGRNEVLARPTLVARAGKTSEFFSGVEVSAAATSGGAGDSVSIEKEIGVKLAVTPEFLPNGMLLLRVRAERTFLTQPDSSVVFEFRLDTSKTTVNADVAMRFGQTLILSGLSERETETDKNATPGLGRVPVAKYLFSEKRRRDFRKSVLILLTPRRAQFLDRSRDGYPQSYKDSRMGELEQRYRDWFRPPSHASEIMRELRENTLYLREYRTGDIPMDNWNADASMRERMGIALRHIYK